MSSSGSRQGNVGKFLLKRCASSGCTGLVTRLGVGKGGLELPHSPGHAVPGNECHGMSALLSPWTGRDSKGEGCGERK